jgi:hypothetical protein
LAPLGNGSNLAGGADSLPDWALGTGIVSGIGVPNKGDLGSCSPGMAFASAGQLRIAMHPSCQHCHAVG